LFGTPELEYSAERLILNRWDFRHFGTVPLTANVSQFASVLALQTVSVLRLPVFSRVKQLCHVEVVPAITIIFHVLFFSQKTPKVCRKIRNIGVWSVSDSISISFLHTAAFRV
jgi:hypothetical protein